jgi:hypothetical protein
VSWLFITPHPLHIKLTQPGIAVEKIARALGMQVLVAERKGASNVRAGRTPFDEALRVATVFIFVTPLDETTRDMIGKGELEVMNKTSLLINVGKSSTGAPTHHDTPTPLRRYSCMQ